MPACRTRVPLRGDPRRRPHAGPLAELFADPAQPLVLQIMYGKKRTSPCPMCTLWADGYDGVVPHLERRVNFAVLVAGDVATFEGWARSRGWRHLLVVSAANRRARRIAGPFFESCSSGQGCFPV